MLPSILTLLLIFLSGFGLANATAQADEPAQSLPPYDNAFCKDSSFRELRVPVDHRRPGAGKILYRYQRFEVSPSAPWVITFPGGPGAAGTGPADPALLNRRRQRMGIPEGYNWIRIDPRGLQCNRMADQAWPEDSITTWQMANDIAAVVRAENIAKPILFGFSYGTLWATMTASLLEAQGVELGAVVLGGVMGAADRDGTSSIQDQINFEFEKFRPRISPELSAALNRVTAMDSFAFAIVQMLYRSISVENGKILRYFEHYVLNADTREPDFLEKVAKKYFADVSLGDKTRYDNEGADLVLSQVGCREVSTVAKDMVVFAAGKFESDTSGLDCKGRRFNGAIDSADYPVRARIVYFQGEIDPATPLNGARYHLEHHPEADRVFLQIPEGAHSGLGSVLPDCLPEFWGIVGGARPARDSFQSCTVKPRLIYLPRAK